MTNNLFLYEHKSKIVKENTFIQINQCNIVCAPLFYLSLSMNGWNQLSLSIVFALLSYLSLSLVGTNNNLWICSICLYLWIVCCFPVYIYLWYWHAFRSYLSLSMVNTFLSSLAFFISWARHVWVRRFKVCKLKLRRRRGGGVFRSSRAQV